MRYDSQTIEAYKQRAKQRLMLPFFQEKKFDKTSGQIVDGPIVVNEFYVPGTQITSPATLVQEQAWVNSKQSFEFDFSINGNKPTAALNNNILPKNNYFAIYGFQLLIGFGDAANNRTYLPNMPTVNDGSVYNSIIQLKIETDTMIDILEGQDFKDQYEAPNIVDQTSGLVLVDPIRVLSGEMGVFKVFINLKNSISALAITPSLFLSMRLKGVMGQASGTKK